MGNALKTRLSRLEGAAIPPGALPTIIIIPDGPDRAAVLADVERRRARGQNIIAIGEGEDALLALVEAAAP